MQTPQEIQRRLDTVLLRVEKPGRYVGGEWNSTYKPWESVPVHLALIFPDVYEIGISNMGIQVLYDQVNQRKDALAERAYAPWVDMEAEMRRANIPLYALESKRPIAAFDIVGFSLPYETLYTSTLNLLDLAGIPLRSADRDETHPLIIAGGHAVTNPEPMHAFIDAFAIGEGEGIIHDVIAAWKAWKASGASRPNLLRQLARIPGVYVPALYQVDYHEDGLVAAIRPTDEAAPATVIKRIVPRLPPPPTRLLVPNIGSVHNRAAVEIMRGCTRGCRYCHAGMIMRPVRERSVDEIVAAAAEAIRNTGFSELALLSLSSSDYSQIEDLVEAISKHFAGQHLSVSLPSLRIESVSIDLMEKLRQRRSSGFTLAPEAATERMRRIINKFIPDEQIIETARAIYQRGWTTIKLYFMIGHPSETLEDVQAIADLCKRVLKVGRQEIGGRAKVHAGVSTFVPKPHTPFQWVACDTPEQIRAKQALLRQELRDRSIKLSWTAPEETLLEAWLSRGDRRMAEVIYQAWRRGAKFDAWQEHANYQAWHEAFATQGLDPAFYTHRQRFVDEIFPWEHISVAVRKNYLLQDYLQSQEGQTRLDCREQCFACGILPIFADERHANPGDYWKCPEVKRRRKTKTPVQFHLPHPTS